MKNVGIEILLQNRFQPIIDSTQPPVRTRTVGVGVELTPKSPSARPSVQFYECHIKLGSHQIALRK